MNIYYKHTRILSYISRHLTEQCLECLQFKEFISVLNFDNFAANKNLDFTRSKF